MIDCKAMNTGQFHATANASPQFGAVGTPVDPPLWTSSPTSSVSSGGAYHLEVRWCWQETPVRMPSHQPISIVGDPSDCMIAYPKRTNDAIEAAFQEQRGTGECSPLPNYCVNFDTMKQTNLRTGYQRELRRVVETEAIAIPVPSLVAQNVTDLGGAGSAPMAVCNPVATGGRVFAPEIGSNVVLPQSMQSPMEVPQHTATGNQPTQVPLAPPAASFILPAPTIDRSTNAPTLACTQTTPNPTRLELRWCWKETPVRMPIHPVSAIVGDPSDCWVSYDESATKRLEAAYHKQRQRGTCKPAPGYKVNFDTMKQKNTRTGYERDVQRIHEEL